MKRFALFALSLTLATASFAQKNKDKDKDKDKGKDAAPAAAAPSKNNGPGPKTKAEAAAVNDILKAQREGPDATIAACDTLVTKFPMSDFKSFALYTEANAYQQKNDLPKSQVFGEQALDADPKSYDAEILLANVLATTTKDTDFDANDKLTKAEKYANDALMLLASADKPALFTMTEEVWAKVKAEDFGMAYQALGMSAQVRKKPQDAIAAYQKGVEANPSDAFLSIRAARAYMAVGKLEDAMALQDKVIGNPDAPAQAKTIATSDKARAQAAKGQK